MKEKLSIFWLRRDLRLDDNTGLIKLLANQEQVQLLFIFDKNILDRLDDKADARVSFIHHQLQSIKKELNAHGKDLWIFYDTPDSAFAKIHQHYHIEAIYANEDYEPEAIARDNKIAEWCRIHDIAFSLSKDQVLFSKGDILKSDGTPYTVYTPYAKAWLNAMRSLPYIYQNVPLPIERIRTVDTFIAMPSLAEIGFIQSTLIIPPLVVDQDIIATYHTHRDYPYLEEGTSKLGVHLRFGTISIRRLISIIESWSEVYLKELIWREFFMMILYHFPHSAYNSFKPKYDLIAWLNDENAYYQWCAGKTGYPLVDAGMRQLNATGWMHNRVRMVCASFLVKHLLIDWRWGEAYFGKKLLDYDLSANVGNWQWAAGSGCDAAPYFRIFNPTTQLEKFDREKIYVGRWVSEYNTLDYPKPIVDHQIARERALSTFKKALQS